jgi:hypothetical protein
MVAAGVQGRGQCGGCGDHRTDGGRRGSAYDDCAAAPAASYPIAHDPGRVRSGGQVQVLVGEQVAEGAV